MRKITAGLFTSVDGVVGEPQTWHFPYFCEELGAAVGEQLGSADTILFGRVTYDSFAGAWPAREEAGEQDAQMAKAIGDARKIVVSHSPLEFTWRNSEQLQGGLVEGVRALKAEPGEGAIGLSGSVSVLRQLLAANLVDELHLYVHPVAVRKGIRLFEDADTPIPLTLLSCTAFKSGTVHMVYGPSEGPALENQDPVAAKIENDYQGA
ncbi:dihydrofolate reductase family protein [Actinospica sp. MGRD01-02]|uniref:Dihydrofolate reductase family protein n=1 Tax=Actinospica acidithermotolerans TaxID=2828514 RepID=A0A941ELX1_9ACTN|nr:dihydrofolate reductase family protein [Actinospica acidithermotolerans]MBR7829969.1 dihydrofolate reductase family protein [Actinospica acidithermotolerans]